MRALWQKSWFRWALVILAVPAAGVAWWLGSPLFLDSEVDEAFPMSAAAAIPDGMDQRDVEREMSEAADEPDVVSTDPMPDEEPTVLSSGVFAGADDFHQASGTATVYELVDGSRVLRLEDFEVTNGPDLHVLAVPAGDPAGRDDIDGYVDLGSLKGNIGNQNYDIPDDLTAFGSIVIYCVPFHVLFASASLS
ncbi:MAG: DM13 domain-containing protein [Acidimicrobiia bacterium]|nr:DM13 domain-containing protein [Acidimicrobiia bacterium]MBT8250058.1 DM13 domain-containing protein [Acidimicrobiia bacterium]NNC42934.1 DM13 domain-containing protein [Acidimicrobiia bacterium]NNL28223.1 DM13 domain-containing protein [Acidimicrobiia bacterium]NNL47385.1 DM13 domain-containing protein [Acidimicrobiia bacterium]